MCDGLSMETDTRVLSVDRPEIVISQMVRGLEPLVISFDCFWICIMPQYITFSLESDFSINKNRSTSYVGGFFKVVPPRGLEPLFGP